MQEMISVIRSGVVPGARVRERECAGTGQNGIFHFAGYWTNEESFGENDGRVSVCEASTTDTRGWRGVARRLGCALVLRAGSAPRIGTHAGTDARSWKPPSVSPIVRVSGGRQLTLLRMTVCEQISAARATAQMDAPYTEASRPTARRRWRDGGRALGASPK